MRTKFTTSIALIILLTGCTEQQTQRPYVSPLEFKSYNCKQISKEMAYVSSQLNNATAANQTNKVLDTAIMAYGISRGYGFTTDDEDPAVAQLKARYDALHQASIQKNCD